MIKTYLEHISFEYPWVLALLLLLPVLHWYGTKREKLRTTPIRISTTEGLAARPSWRTRLKWVPAFCRTMAMACIIVALARPVHYSHVEQTNGEGIEMVLCMDVSGSMLARDFAPDRLRASIDLAADFISRRQGDRIGLVSFAGQSLSLCPLTADLKAVTTQLYKIQYGMLSDGTSIGSGLASAISKLRGGIARSRIIILLTDGEDTGGLIDPETALQMAKDFGFKVYTIGIGKEGFAPMPYKNAAGKTVLEEEKVSIDEGMLKRIAEQTGGQYFRATDKDVMAEIYKTINTLEKSKIRTDVFRKREERFMPWAMAALLLLVLEGIWRTVLLKRLL